MLLWKPKNCWINHTKKVNLNQKFLMVIDLAIWMSLLYTASWIISKVYFKMVLFHTHIVVKGFWQHALWGPSLLVNLHQELPPNSFEFKCKTNGIRKYYLSVSRFEPRWTTDAWANSAMSLLFQKDFL
jgi:hypothetical protein